MALAIDSQEASATGHRFPVGAGSPQTDAYSFTNTAGTIILIGVVVTEFAGSTSDITSVSYGGDACTAIGTGVTWSSAASKAQWFYRLSPKTGANNVSVTWTYTGGSGRMLVGAISFTGNDAGTPVGTQQTATGTSGTAATGNMTNTNGNYLIAVSGHGAGNAPADTNGTGTLTYSLAGSGSTSGDNIGASYFAADGSAHNMQLDWTNSDSWGIVGIEVNASAGGAETITMDKWFPLAAPNKPARAVPIASGIIGIRNT